MNILFLTRRYYPDIGGVEKHVQKLSEELIKLGHNITIISEVHQSRAKINYQTKSSFAKSSANSIKPVKSVQSETFIYKNIQVIQINPGKDDWFKKFRIWKWFIKNSSFIKDFDIVHCHDVFFWYFPLRIILPFKNVFVTFHGYESYPISNKSIINRKVSEVLSSGSICVGEFMKKWYHASPDYVIYGGVSKINKVTNIKKPHALFFGRLDEQTGIKTYLDAIGKIKTQIPGFRLDIVGNGKFKSLVKGNHRNFDPKIENRISSYRYVFVSRYLSILEALVSKKMVFAVYDNSLKEDYLKMTPFKKYINIVNNSTDLATKVKLYYSNNKLEQEIINKGYRWVKGQTWSKVANVYLKLWRKTQKKPLFIENI